MSRAAHVLEQQRRDGRGPRAAPAPECFRCALGDMIPHGFFFSNAAVDTIGQLLLDTNVGTSFDILKVR